MEQFINMSCSKNTKNLHLLKQFFFWCFLTITSIALNACKGHPIKENALNEVYSFENITQGSIPSVSCPKPSIVSYTGSFSFLEGPQPLEKLKGQFHLVKMDAYSFIVKEELLASNTQEKKVKEIGALYTQTIFTDVMDDSLSSPVTTCSARSDNDQLSARYASEFGRVLDLDQGLEMDRIFILNQLQAEGWTTQIKNSRIKDQKIQNTEVSRHISGARLRGESSTRYYLSTDERELLVQKYFQDPLPGGGKLTFHLRLVYQLRP